MMKKEDIREITNRLYKAYSSTELKKNKKYRVYSTNYDFQLNVDSDGRFSLLSCNKGEFNVIKKIIDGLPMLKLFKEVDLIDFPLKKKKVDS